MTFPSPPKPRYPALLPDARYNPQHAAEFANSYASHWQATPLSQRLKDKVNGAFVALGGPQNSSNYNRAATAYHDSGGTGAGGGMGRSFRLLHGDD